jgi:uncharacterized protein
MSSESVPSLTAEELDDLIYYTRVGDLTTLKTTIAEISTSHSFSADQIIQAAIDNKGHGLEASSGCCLLHWPAANGNEQVLSYLLSLLDSKQDLAEGTAKAISGLLNHKNQNGNTPLHWAAVNGHVGCVKVLVAAGSDPAMTNNAGHDALYEADCSGKEGGGEVAEWILANCAGLEKGTSAQAGNAGSATSGKIGAGDIEDEEMNWT